MKRVLLVFAIVSAAVCADATRTEPPCRGCTLDVTDTDEAAPLVVVLHGDTDSARERAEKWRPAVTARGWALLSLQCPAELGCPDGSWYRWRHDPGWVREQVREVARAHHIDATRIYLVGWSGGATFIGKHVQEWPRMFAAVVLHGGGVPPSAEQCPERPLPAYFLVGDKNPAHGAARRLRAYFEACDQEVVWDLVRGANHADEDAALTDDRAAHVLDWLARHRKKYVREARLSGGSGDASL